MSVIDILQLDFEAGDVLEEHDHDQGQILFARSGTMDLTTDGRLYVIPSSRLAWIPSKLVHSIRFRNRTELRTAYVRAEKAAKIFSDTRIFEASPLFRELLLRLVESDEVDPQFRRLLEDTLLAELLQLRDEGLSVRFPKDLRALRVANALIGHPADDRSLSDWAELAACSSKTLSRLFIQQTDMTFQLWRRHVRLLAAIEHLEKGHSITETAHRVGFATSSAFAEAHRLTFGYPPSATR